MLSREERILSELLVSRGIVSRDVLERCAASRDSMDPGVSLVDVLVESGRVDATSAACWIEEARAIDDALAPEIPDGKMLGEFRLVREIGRGGMGIVYEAEQESLGRRVALKVLPAGAALDERLVTRFLREARAAGRLSHPNIIKVFTSGRTAGVLYFAMELNEGHSLSEEIERGPLEPGRAARLVAEVARALDFAHNAGLIHRDIKPDNILIGANDEARLTDFGLVHEVVGGTLTLPHHALGTPAYLAPEQALGESADPRSDVYSLGAVLYTLLCGRPPYDGNLPSAVLVRVVTEPPRPLQERDPDLPQSLTAICERAMSRHIEERHATASALARDLEAFLEDRSTVAARSLAAAREGPLASPMRRGRTRRAAAIAGALAVASLLCAAAFVRRHAAGEASSSVAASSGPSITFRLVNDTPEAKAFPSLSPDGRTLLYTAGDPIVRWNVYRQDLVDGSVTCLTCGMRGGSISAFSPDGKRIAFTGAVGGETGLYVMDLLARTSRRIWNRRGSMTWSADGREVGVAIRESGEADPMMTFEDGGLFILDVTTGKERRLTNLVASLPSWAPHGSRIAFASMTAGQSDILTVSSSGGDVVRVTDDVEPDWSPVWAPDGSRVFFGSERDGRIGIWSVETDLSSGQPRGVPVPLTRTPLVSPFYLSRSAQSGSMAICATRESGRLHRIPFGDAAGDDAAVALPRYPAVVDSPDASPDDRFLAFTAVSTQRDIGVMPADGGVEPTLLTDDIHEDGGPRWSPDGRWIAFHSDRDGTMAIWSIRPDGSGLHRIAGASQGRAMNPVWSPDGAFVAFSSSTAGAFVARVAPGEAHEVSEPPVPLGPGAGSFEPWSWSTDGKTIAGSMHGIVLYDMETRALRRLTDSGEKPLWLRDGRRLLFVSGRTLNVVDARTGESRAVFDAAPSALDPSVALSRDGRNVYASLSSSGTEVWLARVEAGGVTERDGSPRP